MNWLCRLIPVGCLLAFLCLDPACAAPSGGLAKSPWPDYGGGERNAHRANAVGPAGNVRVKWEYSLPIPRNGFNFAHRQPALGEDGSIYFLTHSNSESNAVALKPDGSLKWIVTDGPYAFGEWLAVNSGDLVVHGRAVSSLSPTGQVYARRQSDGALAWSSVRRSHDLASGPTIGSDGTIYASTDGILALSPTGQELAYTTAAHDSYHLAISQDGTLFAASGAVFALGAGGSVQWSVNIGQPLAPLAIGNDGNIYAGSAHAIASPLLVSLTPAGIERWRRTDVGGAPSIGPVGTIYASHSGILHAIDPISGSDLWAFHTGTIDEFAIEGVTIDRLGNLYFANQQGIVTSLTPAGALRWQFDIAPNTDSNVYPGAPVIGANGDVYVPGGYTAKFFALGVPEPSIAAPLLPLIYWLAGMRLGRLATRDRSRNAQPHVVPSPPRAYCPRRQ